MTPPVGFHVVSKSDDEARRHLLLSFPNLDTSESGPDAVSHLVEGAIFHLLHAKPVSGIISVAEVVDAIRSTTDLEYESAEVIRALQRLEALGNVVFKHPEKRAFVFSEKRFRALSDDQRYRAERILAVQREWLDEVRTRHALDESKLNELWVGLDRFIAELMNRYAAEAAAFLYQGEGGHGEGRFAAALEERTPQIADVVGGDLLDIARHEFPGFFDSSRAARTDYLANRLRGAFVFHLLSLDPGAAELVRENVSEKTLYLDTNVVFRLFGFDGPTLAYGPQAVVEMSKLLNCRLLVAEETVHEFLRRLRTETKNLQRHPINQDAFRRLIADHPGDEYTFMKAYYREYLEGKIKSPDQFERKYANVDTLLRGYGIDIDKDAEISDADSELEYFRDLQSSFNTWTKQERHLDNVAHDAFMLLLLREKRGKRDKRAGEVKTWFLTYDRSLAAFSVHHTGADQLPLCILADDWLQITRPFLPRTKDYDRSFVALLQHPVAFEDPDIVPLWDMVEALERLDQFQELPTPVVAAMVSDNAMLAKIRLAPTVKAVKHLIEVEAATYARQQEEAVSRLAQQTAELAERVEQVQSHRDALGATAETVMKERDEARAKLSDLTKDLPEQLAEARRTGEFAAVERIAALAREREEQRRLKRRANVRRGLCYASMLFVLLFVAFVLRTEPRFRSGLRLVLLLAWTAIAFWALNAVARRGWVANLFTKLVEIAGLVGFIVMTWQVFAPDTPAVTTSASEGSRTSPVANQHPAKR